MTGYQSKKAMAQAKLQCQCSMTTRLVGSGCQYCNPEYLYDDDAQPAQEPDVVMHCDSHTWTINNPPPKGSGDVNLYYEAQRKPLTDEQRQELMSKAWNEWLSRKDDGRLFAWSFSFEVEAAHGIKEKNT
jgi:hypothetical protein